MRGKTTRIRITNAFACESQLQTEGVGTYFSIYPTKIWEDLMVTKLKVTSWGFSWSFLFLNLDDMMDVNPY